MQIISVSRLKATRIVLLLITIASVLDSHLLLFIHYWRLIVLITLSFEVKLHTTINQVLLRTLSVLGFVVVNHIPK